MQIINVKIEKPEDTNFILGQANFIKSVEDIHEALVTAVPGIKFGLPQKHGGQDVQDCLIGNSGGDRGLLLEGNLPLAL
jgi:adenosine/AMP kinase